MPKNSAQNTGVRAKLEVLSRKRHKRLEQKIRHVTDRQQIFEREMRDSIAGIQAEAGRKDKESKLFVRQLQGMQKLFTLMGEKAVEIYELQEQQERETLELKLAMRELAVSQDKLNKRIDGRPTHRNGHNGKGN